MFQIIDTQNNHLPVKSGFMSASSAYRWAKKNLDCGSFGKWGCWMPGHRYYIYKY